MKATELDMTAYRVVDVEWDDPAIRITAENDDGRRVVAVVPAQFVFDLVPPPRKGKR